MCVSLQQGKNSALLLLFLSCVVFVGQQQTEAQELSGMQWMLGSVVQARVDLGPKEFGFCAAF